MVEQCAAYALLFGNLSFRYVVSFWRLLRRLSTVPWPGLDHTHVRSEFPTLFFGRAQAPDGRTHKHGACTPCLCCSCTRSMGGAARASSRRPRRIPDDPLGADDVDVVDGSGLVDGGLPPKPKGAPRGRSFGS